MIQFNNLAEAVRYHRVCYICGDRLVHPFQISFDPEKPPLFKWNLSENVDSSTDDILTIDAYTNQITLVSQYRRNDMDLIYNGNDVVDRVFRKRTHLPTPYKGTLFESVHIHCGKCHQFSYTLQVVINAGANKLDAIILNDEFISYEDADKNLHEIRNAYTIDKTEYTYHVPTTPENDAPKRRVSIPLIPLNLQDPAETIARVRKLVVFS